MNNAVHYRLLHRSILFPTPSPQNIGLFRPQINTISFPDARKRRLGLPVLIALTAFGQTTPTTRTEPAGLAKLA